MYGEEESFTLYFEHFSRKFVNFLAMITLMFIVFSGPSDDNGSPIDQTMNFTALVIIIEIDNILGSLLEKKCEKYTKSVDFTYDNEKIEKEFNRAADFVQRRHEKRPIQERVEKVIDSIFDILIFLTYLIPVYWIAMQVLIKPIDD